MSKRHYDIQVQGTARFSVPTDVARALGVRCGDDVHLTVTHKGVLLYKDWQTLRSGLEIYGPDIRKNIKPRSRIHVIARA